MVRRRLAPLAWARRVFVPALLFVVLVFWTFEGMMRASLAPLGRDQGIFQYVAYAILRGEKDYADVRDVNGPLTHAIHMLFLLLGGEDDRRFHLLELGAGSLSFLATGFTLPAFVSNAYALRPRFREGAAWALGTWAVFGALYLQFSYWDQAQRESFFNWFLFPSVGMTAMACARLSRGEPARTLLVASGALSWLCVFGKPTFALFFGLEALFLAHACGPRRLLTLLPFFGGALASSSAALFFLSAFGDVRAYVTILLRDIPAMYRFIWPRSISDIFAVPWYQTYAVLTLSGVCVTGSLVFLSKIPVRAALAAGIPVVGLVGVVAQRKAFPYHFHPVSQGLGLLGLVLLATLFRPPMKRASRPLALLSVALVAIKLGLFLQDSPHVRAVWLLSRAHSRQARETAEYFSGFPEADFFPWPLRQAAGYLKAHTEKGDRVQTYGMDPYVLFLAERLSATPYIYAYDLNCDAAMEGGPGAVPTEADVEAIRRLCSAHEEDLYRRLLANPPAAWVFTDKSPLLSEGDAVLDFRKHAPRVAAWLDGHYEEAARFDVQRIWLPKKERPHTP